MAITITALGTALATGTDAQSYDIIFSPAANSVVVLQAWGKAAAAPGSPTIADTSTQTWTSQSNGTSGAGRQRIWSAIIGSAPGSITVTVDWGATILGCSLGAATVLGGDLTTPIVLAATVNATGTNDTPTVTVGSLANANNAQLFFSSHDNGSAATTPEAGWTELYDVAASTPAQGMSAAKRIADGDTTPSCTLGSSANWRATALELAVAATGGGGWYYNTQQG